MNWINLATIVAVVVMVALGAYFIVWMTKNQKRAAAEYREQMDSIAAGEDRDPDHLDETGETGGVDGGALSDTDRLRFEEQHRSSGSV